MRGMPTSGSRDTGSWPAASRPRIIAASVVSSRAVGRDSRFCRIKSFYLKDKYF
jgi:hypothetical protein